MAPSINGGATIEKRNMKPGDKVPQNALQLLDEQIAAELQEWQAAGMAPQQVGFDLFLQDVKLTTIVNFIQEVLGYSEDQLNLLFKRQFVKNLKQHREQFSPIAKEARLNALRVPAGAEKNITILGPNGQPIDI